MFDCSQAADNRRREVVMEISCLVSTLVCSLLCLTVAEREGEQQKEEIWPLNVSKLDTRVLIKTLLNNSCI